MLGQNKIAKLLRDAGEKLQVREVFATIQGEGPDSGKRAVFIRLTGCHLACTFCFGWYVNNGREPFLTLSKGPKIKLGEAKIGDKILTFDEEGHLTETEITRIIQDTVDEWVEITIAGRKYKVTKDHQFFTNRGLVIAMDMMEGDEILHADPNDIIAFKKRGDRNPMRNSETIGKMVNSHDYKASGKRIAETIAKKKLEGTYQHSFESLTPETRRELASSIGERQQGPNNTNWRGGSSHPLFVQEKRKLSGKLLPCERCGETRKLEIHHKDDDHGNDALDNFERICHPCHAQEHRRGFNFWQSERKDGKVYRSGKEIPKNGLLVSSVKLVDRMKKPLSIRPAPLPIVGITCHPYPTFLADGFWNHNCDTEWDDDADPWMDVETLADQAVGIWEASFGHVKTNDNPLFVLTGGEPLRQDVTLFVERILEKIPSSIIQIETAGSFWRDILQHPSVSVIVSPKTSFVHPDICRVADAFKYVIRATDAHHPEFGTPLSSTQECQKLVSIATPPARLATSDIYLSPCDEMDEHKNRANRKAALEIAMKYGYRLQLQLHKFFEAP